MMTTREWLLAELRKDAQAAIDVPLERCFGAADPWAMRLHWLRKCIRIVEQGPEEPAAPPSAAESEVGS